MLSTRARLYPVAVSMITQHSLSCESDCPHACGQVSAHWPAPRGCDDGAVTQEQRHGIIDIGARAIVLRTATCVRQFPARAHDRHAGHTTRQAATIPALGHVPSKGSPLKALRMRGHSPTSASQLGECASLVGLSSARPLHHVAGGPSPPLRTSSGPVTQSTCRPGQVVRQAMDLTKFENPAIAVQLRL